MIEGSHHDMLEAFVFDDLASVASHDLLDHRRVGDKDKIATRKSNPRHRSVFVDSIQEHKPRSLLLDKRQHFKQVSEDRKGRRTGNIRVSGPCFQVQEE